MVRHDLQNPGGLLCPPGGGASTFNEMCWFVSDPLGQELDPELLPPLSVYLGNIVSPLTPSKAAGHLMNTSEHRSKSSLTFQETKSVRCHFLVLDL